jgi:hypothetical protein
MQSTILVHVRGFEPPKPQGVAVLRTAAANRICLTCTSWRRERGFEPATPEGVLAFRASALSLTRPSLQTWRKRSESNAHIRKDVPLRTGGLATCSALPNKLAVMRGFEPLNPDLHRASDFPGQLFKPLTHITTNRTWRRVFDSTEEHLKWCSALAVRRLRPLGQLPEFTGAGRGHRTPTSEDTAF